MAQIGDEAPWWRVVAKGGGLPIHRRDPTLERLQRTRLEEEGVGFVGDRVDMTRYGWNPVEAEERVVTGDGNPLHSDDF